MNAIQTSTYLEVAENYYSSMLSKDFDRMSLYLHRDVQFIGPIASLQGKDAVFLAAKNFGKILQDFQIRSRFENNHQIMLAYDMTLPAPIGLFRAAVLMDFKDHLIVKIELFYDSLSFVEKKSEIFDTSG